MAVYSRHDKSAIIGTFVTSILFEAKKWSFYIFVNCQDLNIENYFYHTKLKSFHIISYNIAIISVSYEENFNVSYTINHDLQNNIELTKLDYYKQSNEVYAILMRNSELQKDIRSIKSAAKKYFTIY